MFCVEGYVNTPELSAVRGGGLSQGLPATGPYKSLFRARPESRDGNKAAAVGSASTPTPTPAPDAGLHVLADAAQSPEALSPPSAASSAPTPTPAYASAPKKRRSSRKPSPLVAPSPASSVTPLGAATQSLQSEAASDNASLSHVVAGSSPPPQRPPQATKPRGAAGRGKAKEKTPPPSVAHPVPADGNNLPYEQHDFSRQQSGPPIPVAEPCEVKQACSRNGQKNRVGVKEMRSYTPQHPAPANDSDHAEDYYPSYYEPEPSDASHAAVTHQVRDGEQSLSPPPLRTWESPRLSSSTVKTYPASSHAASDECSPALVADSRSHHSLTPNTKLRMLTLLIEDRRNGSDELAEVRVRLKFAEGYFWADAKEVCAALQSGPSRIDGGSLILTDRVLN
jgi:hypothetical protein